MRKLKLVTILGTRPEIIRLSMLIPLLDRHTDHKVIHTGQNFDFKLSQVFFNELKLREPDVYLGASGGSLGSQLGTMLTEIEKHLGSFRPDGVVILGDTNSAMTAIIAERMRIPVFHLEAGNRSFDREVPEELNRKLVDHIASYNLCYTETARSNLLAEGLSRNDICVTGSPLKQVIAQLKPKISDSLVMEELGLNSGQFFLVSAHRQETVDNPERLKVLVESLEKLVSWSGQRVIFSTHPRTRSKLTSAGIFVDKLELMEPFGFVDYMRLQSESRYVLSDSGSLSEESSLLGFRAATIRNSFERQEVSDVGLLATVGLSFESWLLALSLAEGWEREFAEVYSGENFSETVLNFIHSKLLPRL